MSTPIYEVVLGLSWRCFIKTRGGGEGGGGVNGRGWPISQVIGILSSMGQHFFLGPAKLMNEQFFIFLLMLLYRITLVFF